MKVTFATDYFDNMFNLGVEIWSPKFSTWKRLQVSLLIGPYVLTVTFGSRQKYNEETAILKG